MQSKLDIEKDLVMESASVRDAAELVDRVIYRRKGTGQERIANLSLAADEVFRGYSDAQPNVEL